MNAVLKGIQEKGMYGMGKFDEYNTTTKFFGAITMSIKTLLSQSISRSSSDINGISFLPLLPSILFHSILPFLFNFHMLMVFCRVEKEVVASDYRL